MTREQIKILMIKERLSGRALAETFDVAGESVYRAISGKQGYLRLRSRIIEYLKQRRSQKMAA